MAAAGASSRGQDGLLERGGDRTGRSGRSCRSPAGGSARRPRWRQPLRRPFVCGRRRSARRARNWASLDTPLSPEGRGGRPPPGQSAISTSFPLTGALPPASERAANGRRPSRPAPAWVEGAGLRYGFVGAPLPSPPPWFININEIPANQVVQRRQRFGDVSPLLAAGLICIFIR